LNTAWFYTCLILFWIIFNPKNIQTVALNRENTDLI